MTKDELLEELKRINEEHKGDRDMIHSQMDSALLEYINDLKITDEFFKEIKWCG